MKQTKARFLILSLSFNYLVKKIFYIKILLIKRHKIQVKFFIFTLITQIEQIPNYKKYFLMCHNQINSDLKKFIISSINLQFIHHF